MTKEDLLDVLRAYKSYQYLQNIVIKLTSSVARMSCEDVEGLDRLFDVIWRNSKFAESGTMKDEEAFEKIMNNEKLTPEQMYEKLV